ncbi:Glyoxalase/Bleomycin resistance protein/Dihydroxybiphenyl dioxygenase [Gaertneriomyces semiglobifer]|nr:Glyoxalase/Bleomycin resistance protein/Dihydroxybiphenyl dioxygenase [Gaertneriomyces semiglobifer]
MATTNPANYEFNHTMYRVKDPQKSIDFYTKLMGMSLIVKLDFEEAEFSLYFLAYGVPEAILSSSHEEKRQYAFSRPGVLELTHNWGTESDSSFEGYHTGNKDPKGYGHIGVIVDDVDACCNRLEQHGVNFVKKPQDGRMKNIAFVTDPDGYWVEILPKRYN